MENTNNIFAENLRSLREKSGLSQKQLGAKMFVSHFTIARWENGSRLPDAAMILRLSEFLGVDTNTLFQLAAQSDENPNVIIVDDNSIILSDSIAIMEEVMPNAMVTGFIWPQEAIEYSKANRVDLAILDIELGNSSGLDLCHTLYDINPATNVVFLTAYADYSLDAWKTEACGFILKPMTPDGLKEQLKKLRFPLLMREVADSE
ncbi:MAG: response regulator [Lachnospiraceae bacterium]|nr:response regulator [Lachnospiraceae bacterium]